MLNDRYLASRPAVPSSTQAQQEAAPPEPATPNPPPLDAKRVEALQAEAAARTRDAAPRVELGDLYFAAGEYPNAIKWYEAALALDPKDADLSTNLGLSYYYTDQPDRALEQFKHSLSIDPKHTKTMLSEGVVRAFSKQDIKGAAAAWEQVLKLAPDSAEGRAARQALESLKAAHPAMGGEPGQVPPGS
jgi:tetratricopeptide (TPR) repeat protein